LTSNPKLNADGAFVAYLVHSLPQPPSDAKVCEIEGPCWQSGGWAGRLGRMAGCSRSGATVKTL